MTNDQVTYRHARNALDLIINGAVRQIESQYADALSSECHAAIDNLIGHLREELDSWERPDALLGDNA